MRYQKFLFRLFLVYFFLQATPLLDVAFYRDLFSIDWGHLTYGDIFTLAHFGPQRYIDWVIVLGIAAVVAGVWGYVADRPEGRTVRVDDTEAYYWVRVIVRYRLAIAMIAYGFIKLYPLQSPYPSISNLNTNYGDFTRWKLFSLSLGVVPNYESFLGGVEIVGGLLLFWRKTASVGAFIIAIFLGNVFMSNLAYGGGDDVYSAYLITLSLFVLSWDAQRLFNLLLLQRKAAPNRYHPVFAGRKRTVRLALKAVFIFFFVVLYGFKVGGEGGYQFPTAQGLPGAAGVYNVSQFIVGKDTLAYSRTDSTRWQDVVFERWSTLSIKSNRPVVLDSTNVEQPLLTGNSRDYELEGSAGRQYYSYTVDSARQLITLQNKNPHYGAERWVLHYDRPAGTRIVLSGLAGNDSVYAVLDKVNKKYLLEEARTRGRQGGLSL